MNHCPDCGSILEFINTIDDVATFHSQFRCPKCTAEWEETVEKGYVDKLLSIVRVEGGEYNG